LASAVSSACRRAFGSSVGDASRGSRHSRLEDLRVEQLALERRENRLLGSL
jgi:hypothetical protein